MQALERINATGEGIGAQLRRLRTLCGLSLGALSARSGVHKATLSRWEAGIRQPGIPELEAVLTALSATPDERHEALRLLGASGAPRALRVLRNELRAEATQSHLPSPLLLSGSMPGQGSLLRALRSRRGWSQEQVAAHFGLHLSAVSRWERGEAWPEPERLQALCALLGATSTEAAALAARDRSPGANDDEDGMDSLEYRFRSVLAPVALVGELYSELDLSFLSLEASLWVHAAHREAVRPLLGEVYSHHANYLRNRQRFVEAGHYAQKSLAVADDENFLQNPDWVELAAVCSADAVAKGGRRPQPQRAEGILRWWLTRGKVSLTYSAWMLRKISDYQCAQDRFRDAIETLDVAARLSEQLTNQVETPISSTGNSLHSSLEVQRYRAGTLLAAGRVEEALRWLPQEVESYSVNRLRDALLWSEAHFRVGHRSEAHEWTGRAFAEVATHGLAHRLPDVERIATLL